MTEQTETNRPKWAQVVSDVFCPLLIPTYAMALAMWVTPLRTVPEGARLLATLMVGIITGVIPLAAIAMLIRRGLVSDRAISDRRQRTLPMLIGGACYLGAGFFVGALGAPMWLRMFFGGAALATVIALVISHWWKISAHATALGGLVGMMLWMAFAGLADVNVMIMLSIGIAISGLVGTTRLLLGRHSPGQVAAGFMLGFVCCFAVMCIN